MAWTTPATAIAGSVLTAAFWNTQVRDNTLFLFDQVQNGNWTPVLTATTGGPTHFIQSGHYAKIGRLVIVDGFVQIISIATASGAIGISGLPFPTRNVANATSSFAIGLWNLTTPIVTLLGELSPNASAITPLFFATGASANPVSQLQWSDAAASTYFEFKFSYVSETP
jgi:hypothetical protein